MRQRRPGDDVGAAFAAAASTFADTVAAVDLRAPVASCPGWTAYDLVLHLGNVHAWAATVVETRSAARQLDDRPRTTRAREVGGWYAAKAEDLYAVLRAAPHDAPCWNFAQGHGVVGFWPRRQLHETGIHQVDLDRATGREETPVLPQVAADGVDEVLGVFLPRMAARGHPAALTAPLALEASDTGDRWLLAPGDATPLVHRGRAPDGAAAAIGAPAAVLHRLLWGRADLGDPEVVVTGSDRVAHDFVTSRLVP